MCKLLGGFVSSSGAAAGEQARRPVCCLHVNQSHKAVHCTSSSLAVDLAGRGCQVACQELHDDHRTTHMPTCRVLQGRTGRSSCEEISLKCWH